MWDVGGTCVGGLAWSSYDDRTAWSRAVLRNRSRSSQRISSRGRFRGAGGRDCGPPRRAPALRWPRPRTRVDRSGRWYRIKKRPGRSRAARTRYGLRPRAHATTAEPTGPMDRVQERARPRYIDRDRFIFLCDINADSNGDAQPGPLAHDRMSGQRQSEV